MLNVTDNAASEIRNLVADPDVPDDGGVRLAADPQGELSLELVGAEVDGDAVVENDGARVFVDQQANDIVDDKALDAGIDDDGQVVFVIAAQPD